MDDVVTVRWGVEGSVRCMGCDDEDEDADDGKEEWLVLTESGV